MICIVGSGAGFAPCGWDYPLEEIDYLLDEHDGETFVLIGDRLYEAEEV